MQMKWMVVLESQGNVPTVDFYNGDFDLNVAIKGIIETLDRYTEGVHFFKLDHKSDKPVSQNVVSVWYADHEFNVFHQGRITSYYVEDANVFDNSEMLEQVEIACGVTSVV